MYSSCQFRCEILTPLAFLTVTLFVLVQGRPVKRVAFGYEANSQEDLGTYHYVSLRERHGCLSNQVEHNLSGCTEKHECGGTLFREDFVITAAHCVVWHLFYLRKFSDIYKGAGIPEGIKEREYYGHFDDVIIVSGKNTRPHAFYSNIALFAGSTHALRMEQMRHAFKKFIHPYYGFGQGRTSKLEHDVAMVQVCEPFQITKNVRLAPVKPLDVLAAQYESIVKRAAACLYVGFGLTEDRRAHQLDRLYIAGTPIMRFTWRQVACHSKCNFNRTLVEILGYDAPRNPCHLCSDHIPPDLGSASSGDSGGPIACDGYFVGVIVGGSYNVETNQSVNPGYPLNCIRDAIRPQRLEYYRSLSEKDPLHTLSPVFHPFTVRP